MPEPMSKIGWARLPSWDLAPFCEAPRHLTEPFTAPGAEWRVALSTAGQPAEFYSMCQECVEAIAADLGITVEAGAMVPPPVTS